MRDRSPGLPGATSGPDKVPLAWSGKVSSITSSIAADSTIVDAKRLTQMGLIVWCLESRLGRYRRTRRKP